MTRYVDPKIIQRELKKLVKNTNFYSQKLKKVELKIENNMIWTKKQNN